MFGKIFYLIFEYQWDPLHKLVSKLQPNSGYYSHIVAGILTIIDLTLLF